MKVARETREGTRNRGAMMGQGESSSIQIGLIGVFYNHAPFRI